MQTQTISPLFNIRVGVPEVVMPVNVDAVIARRKVSGWAGGYVSTSCRGHTPELIIQDAQPFWRVPVVFTRIGQGIVGEIGFVMVDAQTGDMVDATEPHADELRNNGIALAQRIPAPPFKIRTAPPLHARHAQQP